MKVDMKSALTHLTNMNVILKCMSRTERTVINVVNDMELNGAVLLIHAFMHQVAFRPLV